MSIEGLTAAAAVVPLCMAVVVLVVGIARVPAGGRRGPAELVASIGLALEFLLAAGLLRLNATESLLDLAGVAAIVALRRLIGVGLRAGVRALGLATVARLRA